LGTKITQERGVIRKDDLKIVIGADVTAFRRA